MDPLKSTEQCQDDLWCKELKGRTTSSDKKTYFKVLCMKNYLNVAHKSFVKEEKEIQLVGLSRSEANAA